MVDWLYVDFNSFFASCEQQEDAALRGKPVAVVPMLADSTSCIAASYEAKAFGVKTGVKVGEAKKMCPGLILRPARHSIYVKYHHRALEAIESVIPIHSVCSVDEICCELTGSQKQLATAQALVAKLKNVLREKLGACLTVSVGLGPNVLLSKMAADMKKPDGLTWIQKEELPHKLYSLQPKDIPGVGYKMDFRLKLQGIHTMEQLLSLTEQQMRALWKSVVGARYYKILRGESFFLNRSEQKSISHQHVLPPKERNFKDTEIVLQKLLVKAAMRLRRSGWMARRLGVSVRFLNGTKWRDEIAFDETHNTSVFVTKLLQMLKACPRSQRPIKAAIYLWDFVSDQEHQLSFFENEKKSRYFKIVDQINEKYGKNTIYLASLHDHLKSAPTRIAFSRVPELDELEKDD